MPVGLSCLDSATHSVFLSRDGISDSTDGKTWISVESTGAAAALRTSVAAVRKCLRLFRFHAKRQRLIVEPATEIRRLRLPGFARQLVRHLTSKRVIGSRFLSNDSRREFHLLGTGPSLFV